MRSKLLSLVGLWLLFISCNNTRPFRHTETYNPEFIPNTLFIPYKDSSYPKFKALNDKYQLDTIFHGERDEFKRILLLRHWIKKTIPVGVPPSSGGNSAEDILDQALKGIKFWCSHFMIVQSEVMTACGIVSRVINADEGEPDLPGQIAHHGTNEIWSNTFHKWFFSDAMFDIHLEKNGIPLSALEIRDEYLKNKAADIIMVYGPERKPIDFYPDNTRRSKEHFARVFTWIAWFKQNDIYSNWDNGISYLIMYEDDYFKNHKWLRSNGKPHWAYGTQYMVLINDRKQLYWTPNTIRSKVVINGNTANIELNSITAFLKSYQMKEEPDGDWIDVSNITELELKNNKNEMLFRTVNLEGIAGAEHRIVIEK